MGVTVMEPGTWAELHELWARLDRMKTGIGGWVLVAASMPAFSPEAIAADDRIRVAVEEALELRARIRALTEPGEPEPEPEPERGGDVGALAARLAELPAHRADGGC